MDKIVILLRSVCSLIFLVAVSLSTLGIYLLQATKPLNNSKIILINLASSEIANSAVEIIISHIMPFTSNKAKLLAMRKLNATSWIIYYFAMYLLTADRLVATLNPFKYRIFVTQKRLTRFILATWTLAVIIGTSFFLSTRWFEVFDKHLWIAYDVFFVILCSITYGLIFFKIRSRRWFNNDKKFFKITSLIILSFIIFILIPDIMFLLYSYRNKIVLEIVSTMWLIGMMVDPVIYIFLQPDLRSLLKSKCCRTKIEEASVQDTAL